MKKLLLKISQKVKTHEDSIILLIGVILISLLSFALGYITAKTQEKEPIRIENLKSEILNSKQILQTKSKRHLEFRDYNSEFV